MLKSQQLNSVGCQKRPQVIHNSEHFEVDFLGFESKARCPTVTVPGRRLSHCLAAHLTFQMDMLRTQTCASYRRPSFRDFHLRNHQEPNEAQCFKSVLPCRLFLGSEEWMTCANLGTQAPKQTKHETIHVISCHHSWSKRASKTTYRYMFHHLSFPRFVYSNPITNCT